MAKWFSWIKSKRDQGRDDTLAVIQERFARFLRLLEANNRVLRMVGDLEEKAQGEYLFDVNYIDSTLREIRTGVEEIIDVIVALGGESYAVLREHTARIDAELESILRGERPIMPDDYTIPFGQIGRGRVASVGSKNAQLGELRTKLGLQVPDGFAITATAYRHFVDSNDLQERITRRIESVDIKRHEDLAQVSDEIREMVISSPVPRDLADDIRRSFDDLRERCGAEGYALRSSAIGEDTHDSFAGQYLTLLNIRGDQLIDRYREILASKYSPKAIYYLLSHSYRESDVPMSVGCVEMVDAASSGVVYTRNPVRPRDGSILINAILGLGPHLVDGTLSPDVYRLSREDCKLLDAYVPDKPYRLVMGTGPGTTEEVVPGEERAARSLSDGHLRELLEIALRVERHYDAPQDIEWALDGSGRIFLLQTRPLRLVRAAETVAELDLFDLDVVLSGGATVCPGAGTGIVHHVSSSAELPDVPDGAVLVALHPFPGLIEALDRISALVTEVGGVASHMATLAREYRVPTIMGMPGATGIPAGEAVTVDATSAAIYAGEHRSLVEIRRPDFDRFDDNEMLLVLRRVLSWISPLNLLHPGDPSFAAENCRTVHDVTRFCHQKAMQEMFERASGLGHREGLGLRLKSEIPLDVVVFYLDQDPSRYVDRQWIEQDAIESDPMTAFWSGVREEGWPLPPAGAKGIASVAGRHVTVERGARFSKSSFAILSREYMIVSLRMGYHFITIEAMCSAESGKNFIGMQYKQGGASLDRRLRRLRLITTILMALGFENSSKSDFLDSRIAYIRRDDVLDRLRLVGRLIMMTKQLDMALSNDDITDWYINDFKRKLGMEEEPRQDSGGGPE